MDLILDFDHTLFNAEEFKQALRDRLALFEISSSQFDHTYQAIKHKFGYYNYPEHLKILASYKQLNEYDLILGFQEVIDTAKEFLYPDTTSFLNQLKNNPKLKIFLLTLGQDKFQQAKVSASGIKNYFNQVFDIQKSKLYFFENHKEFSHCIFVDDRGKKIDEIKKRFPQITAIWLKRPHAFYEKEKCELKNYQAETLAEVLEVIKTIVK